MQFIDDLFPRHVKTKAVPTDRNWISALKDLFVQQVASISFHIICNEACQDGRGSCDLDPKHAECHEIGICISIKIVVGKTPANLTEVLIRRPGSAVTFVTQRYETTWLKFVSFVSSMTFDIFWTATKHFVQKSENIGAGV